MNTFEYSLGFAGKLALLTRPGGANLQVDYVVEDLVQSNEEYPIVSRLKTFKLFKRHFVEFWDAFVTEFFDSELLFTSTVVHQFVDWCSTLSRCDSACQRHRFIDIREWLT